MACFLLGIAVESADIALPNHQKPQRCHKVLWISLSSWQPTAGRGSLAREALCCWPVGKVPLL